MLNYQRVYSPSRINQFQTGVVIDAGTPYCSAASTSPETWDSTSQLHRARGLYLEAPGSQRAQNYQKQSFLGCGIPWFWGLQLREPKKVCQPRQGKLATFDCERVSRPLNSGLVGQSDFSETQDIILNPGTEQRWLLLFTCKWEVDQNFVGNPLLNDLFLHLLMFFPLEPPFISDFPASHVWLPERIRHGSGIR